MVAEWYLLELGRDLGPYSAEDLRRMALCGRICPEDLVRNGTGGNWVLADKITGLFEGVAKPAPARRKEEAEDAEQRTERDSVGATEGHRTHNARRNLANAKATAGLKIPREDSGRRKRSALGQEAEQSSSDSEVYSVWQGIRLVRWLVIATVVGLSLFCGIFAALTEKPKSFHSFAGTWKASDGSQLTITNQGHVTGHWSWGEDSLVFNKPGQLQRGADANEVFFLVKVSFANQGHVTLRKEADPNQLRLTAWIDGGSIDELLFVKQK